MDRFSRALRTDGFARDVWQERKRGLRYHFQKSPTRVARHCGYSAIPPLPEAASFQQRRLTKTGRDGHNLRTADNAIASSASIPAPRTQTAPAQAILSNETPAGATQTPWLAAASAASTTSASANTLSSCNLRPTNCRHTGWPSNSSGSYAAHVCASVSFSGV